MTFYTYMWLREDGTPYYVGKGSGKRAFQRHRGRRCSLVPPLKNNILVQEFPDEQSAFEAEKFLISLYGRKDLGTGILVNATAGGDGPMGLIHTPEQSEKMVCTRKSKGAWHTVETSEKIGAANKGRPAANKGIPLTSAQKEKLRKPKTEEAKSKYRAAWVNPSKARLAGIERARLKKLGKKHTLSN